MAQATIDREPGGTLTSKGRGAAADTVFRYAALGAGLSILLVLGGIAVSTTQKAWPAFAKAGLSYVFTDNWNPNTGDFGALSFIYGTIVVSLIAVIVAVPVSVGIALFVTEASGLPRSQAKSSMSPNVWQLAQVASPFPEKRVAS